MAAPRRDDGDRVGIGDYVESWELDPRGAGFVLTGTVLLLASFTVLDWFRGQVNLPDPTFSGVHDFITAYLAHADAEGLGGYFSTGAAGPYFSWFGWTLLFVGLLAGLLAVSRLGREHWSLRWLGAVVAATGVGLTFLAIDIITVQGNPPDTIRIPTYSVYLSNTSVGAWAAIGGFLMFLVGSLLPRGDR